ncbi:hypothetical protein OUZ56_014812 [Daphnia magna]|uniref:Ufm1-specific protease 2 n=2 Tax=Daphnia magna TaxID=35525 RepID=A0ABR0AL56_9CRUS|nr:hypothetical protein OUZ56_014812 [Daphnia magna]
MSTKVVLLSTLVKRLERYQGESAVLYGIKSVKTVTVVTFLNQQKVDENYENILPAGLERIGAFGRCLDEINSDNYIALVQDEKLKCFIQDQDNSFKSVPFKTVDDVDLATLRVETKISVQLSSKEEETDRFLEKLLDKINSDAASFVMDKSKVALLCSGDKSVLYGAPQDVNVEELTTYMQDEDEEENIKTKKKSVVKDVALLFKLYWSTVLEDASSDVPQCAPLIYHQRRNSHVLCLSFDTISVVPWSDPAENIGPILCMAITRQLKLMMEDLKEQLRHTSIRNIEIPKIFHFHPESLQHYVTLVYHPQRSDQSLESYRKDVHQWFDLPLDRPIFKRGNKHWFAIDYENSRQLINTHMGLNLTGSNVSLVQGRYAYHHYMQDNFDDNGWGCAYRSLQSIISWFRLQGYTERTVPTHHEIQQCLVDIGDKPPSFVKSRQWIGSMEVSFCLQTLLGVESTILNVSSGAEMSSKAQQIAEHFRTHGTPIMIGGGVLAHTIIGIDFKEDMADARFLILDPHYTGGEDLRVIQNKGWCNWKPSSFWKADSFYNMCLPLRPTSF